ncbi:MAG: methylmalonyl-CoA epimerase [Longimicrobiales bacterium]|nr:methylmalonyl-CoA epimerase [Longimicrobiales bacterium]
MNVFPEGARDLDHVAVAVSSLGEAGRLLELLSGQPGSPPETVEAQGVRVAFYGKVELLEPLGPDTPVGRFLAKRGPGLHHIAYRSTDIPADLERLAEQGIELIDSHPRPGARGHVVAFLHPRSTGGILVELVQHLTGC